ncbi:hypothetical protein B0H11DRAFT_2081950 [Mycena galericulata]|nr:hypothetical protein B0H11DRAFT_2081950 [Mycena galericulata]
MSSVHRLNTPSKALRRQLSCLSLALQLRLLLSPTMAKLLSTALLTQLSPFSNSLQAKMSTRSLKIRSEGY